MSTISGLEQRLRDLLRERSITQGDFVLASGGRSTFYIDARRTTMAAEGLAVIGALALERLATLGWRPDVVGGLGQGEPAHHVGPPPGGRRALHRERDAGAGPPLCSRPAPR